MTFRVGMKVVCVDASPIHDGQLFMDHNGNWLTARGGIGSLSKGSIYTVCSIIIGSHATCLVLAEIYRGHGEMGFRAVRFRPVVERKTDISCFTKMLTPTGVDAPLIGA